MKLLYILAAVMTVFSPNGHFQADFMQTAQPPYETYYTLCYKGDTVLNPSKLGLNIDNRCWEMALGWRTLPQYEKWMHAMQWDSVSTPVLIDDYRAITIYLSRKEEMPAQQTAPMGNAKQAEKDGRVRSNYRLNIEVRMYNDGMAFRYFFPEHPNAIFHKIVADETTYSFPQGTMAYAEQWAQAHAEHILVDSIKYPVEMPLLCHNDSVWTAILTADTDDWCLSKLKAINHQLSTIMYSPVDIVTYYATPWKIIMAAHTPGDILEKAPTRVKTLNPPPKGDFSWVKPGKIMRETTLTMDGAYATIDFCAAHNIQYMLFDWKWYEPCTSHDGDATKVIDRLDMPAICQYAKTKGVGVWLYVNQHALMKQARQLFPILKQWGVVGVKSGFVQYASHRWTTWLHDLVRLAADNQLMMNIHDEYRPTGFSYTYPNLLTQEGICGNEEFPDGNHNVRLAFTRMLAGAADYTICYYDKRLTNTHAHQLAASMVYESPLVTLFWYDRPAQYNSEPEMTWFEQLPVTWDETKVLAGNPDSYILLARRKGTTWFVAALNNATPRQITIDLSAICSSKAKLSYLLFTDDPSVPTKTQVRVTSGEVNLLNARNGRIPLTLQANGGATMIIKGGVDVIAHCDRKIHRTMEQMKQLNKQMPRNVLSGQTKWNTRPNIPAEWCGGFWDGCLWYDYALTKKKEVLHAATQTANSMLYLPHTPVYDHDLGFLTITSLLNGYRFSPDRKTRETYRQALLQCADSLATLFNPAVGTMLSWPRNVQMFGGHNTIMDNMINLELLFWAAEQSESHQPLKQIAMAHADTTMAYHFRPDGTSYHVAVYNQLTGQHIYNCTHQGYDDESVWARGQAWAIYGYTMVYRYTKEQKHLDMAQKATDAYLKRLPPDAIPYWDFHHPNIPYTARDASAAAIVASALYELTTYVDKETAEYYKAQADKMMENLAEAYWAPQDSPAILAHATGHYPAGTEIDASIIYADYYYLEALYRQQNY